MAGTADQTGAKPSRSLPRNVIVAGFGSLFTDISSEMIVPVLPLFLTTVLGASPASVGLIEGLAEATASLLKVVSGWWSDRIARRKPFMLLGYGLSNVIKPLFALATSWPQVLVIRVADRFGKGLRGAPRDALIAESVDAGNRGRAFGFHRMMDTMGATIGPLVAYWLLSRSQGDFRQVFWWSALPGLISVVVLALWVREGRRKHSSKADGTGASSVSKDAAPGGAVSTLAQSTAGGAATANSAKAEPLGSAFGWLVAVATLFAIGNSSDAFLILRARDLGLAEMLVPLAYFSFNLVYSLLSWPAGAWSDKIGRRPLLVAGYIFFALIYLGFARATGPWQVWPLFALYGLYYAATEGVQKALIVDIVPAGRRGTAIGILNALVGIAALPASLIAGYLWQRYGFAWSFYYGAAAAVLAAVGLLMWPYEKRLRGVQ